MNDVRKKVVQVMVTEEEFEAIKKAAENVKNYGGMSVSSYCRYVILTSLEEK